MFKVIEALRSLERPGATKVESVWQYKIFDCLKSPAVHPVLCTIAAGYDLESATELVQYKYQGNLLGTLELSAPAGFSNVLQKDKDCSSQDSSET